jgi:hypothetical protein
MQCGTKTLNVLNLHLKPSQCHLLLHCHYPFHHPDRINHWVGRGGGRAPDANSTSQVENKVAALRAYRQAHNLCQYCAEKWVRGHKCAPMVQLQAMQGLWDLLSEDSDTGIYYVHSDVDAQVHMILSQEAVSVVTTSKTLKFLGNLQGHSVVILIDSGSSHSFVNATLVAALSGISTLHKPLLVQVANG